jgi:hypothetical protein
MWEQFKPSIAYGLLSVLLVMSFVFAGKVFYLRWGLSNSEEHERFVLLVAGIALFYASIFVHDYKLKKLGASIEIRRATAMNAMICSVGISTVVTSAFWFLLHR